MGNEREDEMDNPIIRMYQSLSHRDHTTLEATFDYVNEIAWENAGRPDDRAGSVWESLEHEAWAFIEADWG